MDLLALIIASFTFPAVAGAVLLGVIGHQALGTIGAIIGGAIGYSLGVVFAQRFVGAELSPYAKGWVSLGLFIGGLAVLAIATR